jgi:hypothetical protein
MTTGVKNFGSFGTGSGGMPMIGDRKGSMGSYSGVGAFENNKTKDSLGIGGGGGGA